VIKEFITPVTSGIEKSLRSKLRSRYIKKIVLQIGRPGPAEEPTYLACRVDSTVASPRGALVGLAPTNNAPSPRK